MSLDLALALNRIGNPRILCIGDHLEDIDVHGHIVRQSQESNACPVFATDRVEKRAGGGGAVANMVAALGAETEVLYAEPIGQKIRHFVDGRLVFRADFTPNGEAVFDADSIRRALNHCPAAVLIADYSKGVCTDAVLRATIDGARERGIPVIVDPAHGADWARYAGAAIKCNKAEWHLANMRPWPITVVTMGDMGIQLMIDKWYRFPVRRRNCIDVTGAGDMCLGAIGVCVAAGLSWQDACKIAVSASGLKVERHGAVPVPRCEVIADLLHGTKIIPAELLSPVADANRSKGVVLTTGCFDGLTRGHLHLLTEAKEQGGCLIVALNADAHVRATKGAGRPVHAAEDRAAILAGLECVDYVVIFDGEQELTNIAIQVRPNVHVVGAEYRGQVTGSEYAHRLHFVERIAGYSTTETIQRLTSIR